MGLISQILFFLLDGNATKNVANTTNATNNINNFFIDNKY